MSSLTYLHWIYLIITGLICISLIRKKDIALFSIIGILVVSILYSKSFIFAIQALCRGLIVSFQEFLPIFIGISVIMSMTSAMQTAGVNKLLIKPIEKYIKTPLESFFIIGCFMFLFSILIWPSPAVALIGALLVPLASNIGLPAVYTAVAMNIFGHGVALSGDFFIQGVPEVAAQGANLSSADLMPYLIPLWTIMSITTILVSAFFMKRDLKKTPIVVSKQKEVQEEVTHKKKAIWCIVVTVTLFLIDIISMLCLHITGDDATYLISGTALIITCIIAFIFHPRDKALDKISEYIEKGFSFSIKVFAPAVVIIAFFSLGNQEYSSVILDENAPGFISDIISQLVSHVKVTKPLSTIMQVLIGGLYSLDGSGFAGLSVIGTIAKSLSISLEQTKLLTALGQVVIIWIGGGTIIPWSVIPVAAVCQVSPIELARKNIIPVLIGLGVTTIAAIVMLGFIG